MANTLLFGLLILFVNSAVIVFGDEVAEEESLLKWEAPKEIKKNFPYYLSGQDEEGAQIWFLEMGKWNITEVAVEGGESLANFRKYLTQMWTRMGFKHRRSEKNLQSIVIMDLDGLTHERVFHAKTMVEFLDMMKKFTKFAQGGGFKRGIYVNANYVFQTLFSIIRPVIGNLAEATEIYGTNTAQWMPKLLKSVPKDQIPAKLGGDADHKYLAVYG